MFSAIGAHAQAPSLLPNWNQLSPTNSPSARFSAAMAYDAQTGQVVLFGGQQNNTQFLNDTWLWNGTNWTQASPLNSPPAQSAAAMAYDAATQQVVLFDGYGPDDGNTWVWNGSNWSNTGASGPSPRFDTTMVYDAATQQVVLFGGTTSGQDSLGDTWVWNGSSWSNATPSNPSNSPSARAGQGMAYDAALGEVVLFGGYTEGEFGNYLSDTWVWNGSSWSNTGTSGPAARWDFGMDYDAATGQVIIFGGNSGGPFYNDTWAWNGGWSEISSGSPGSREVQNGLVYDAAQQQMVLFGGFSGGFPGDGDTWEYGPPQNFSSVNVCPASQGSPTPCNNTLTLTYNVPSGTTLGTTQVVTQGAGNLDFQDAGNDSCTGNGGGDTCTVTVTFTPQAPGLRQGAVELFSSTNSTTPLVTTLIYGVGQAPELAYGPATGNQPSGLESVVPGLTNSLYSANGMTTDALGNLYITNYLISHQSNVLKVAPGGAQVTTIGGFVTPEGVAIDGAGNLYVADNGLNNGEVVELAPSCASAGCGSVVYSQPSNGSPTGVAVDGLGDVFVADLKQGLIEIPAGCGSSTCWVPVGSGWNQASAVAVDASGDLFVAASGAHEVVEMPAGCTNNSCQIQIGSNWASPASVAVDPAGDLVVADYGLNGGSGGVVEIPADCLPGSCQAPLTNNGQAIFSYGVTVNAAGEIFIADDSNLQILQVNTSQPPKMAFQATPWALESTDSPQSLSLLNVGNQTLDFVGIFPGSDWQQAYLNGTPADCTNSSPVVPGQGCNLSIDFIPEGGSDAVGVSSSVELLDNSLNGSYAQQDIITTGSTTGIGSTSYQLTAAVSGSGSGSVTDAIDYSINCTDANGAVSGTCSANYTGGELVTLSETPNGSTFAGWGGPCSGTSTTCTVIMNQAQTVSASFVAANFGSANVCPGGQGTAPCSTGFPVNFNFTANSTPGTVNSIVVVTQGYTGLDFQDAMTGDTCNGVTVSAGNSCTVNVTFTPQGVGLRTGAVNLYDGSGNLLATQLIFGIGNGAVAAFNPLQTFVRYLGGPNGNNNSLKPANSIPLNQPQGVTVDAQGNIFMSDTANSQVLELQGNATNPVGTGFTSPQGLAIDGAGDLFVADPNYYGNGSGGEVVEVPAGCTTNTCQIPVYNTSATSYEAPTGVAVDVYGDLFVADPLNGAVTEIFPGGSQTMVYGTEGSLPQGVAVDAAGDVFVADPGWPQVVEIPTSCTGDNFSCQVPIGGYYPSPVSVAVDAAGDVYVTDTQLNNVTEVPPGCVTSTCEPQLAGNLPSYGVAVDPLGVVDFVNYGFGANTGALEQILQQFYGLSYPQTLVGAASQNYINLQNVGNQTLTTTALTLSDPSDDFYQGGPGSNLGLPGCTGSSSLSPGNACYLGLTFNPQSPGGQINGTVTFTDNGLNNATPTQTFTLSGTGIPGTGSYFLTVTESGTGGGSVTSGDGLINCSLAGGSTTGVCISAPSNQTVTLTASAIAGSAFAGWGGACSGTSLTCMVTMGQAQNVTANFTQGSFGSGTVCTGSGCSPTTQSVTLTPAVNVTDAVVNVVTQGASNLDFTLGSTTCNVGGAISSGSSCTVTVNFTPTAPGLRTGAVELFDGSTLVETQLLSGIGQGPAISFNPATQVPVNVTGDFTLGPNDAAVDAAGDVFISDGRNAQIVEVAAGTGTTTTLNIGSFTPQGLALDGAGNLFVATSGSTDPVIEFPAGCKNFSSCGSTVYNPGGNSSPADVAVDGSGDLFIADAGLHEIVEIPAGGAQAVVYPASPNSQSVPYGVAVDSAGDLFIADTGLKQVVELPAGGGAQIPIGGGWNSPNSVAVDAAGDVYVVDIGIGEPLVEVPPNCTGGSASSSCVVLLSNQEGFPAATLALDGLGDVFVAEPSQYQVVELQAASSATVSLGLVGENYQSNQNGGSDTPLFIQNIGNGSQPLTGSVGAIVGQYYFEDTNANNTCDTFSLAPAATCSNNYYFYPQNVIGLQSASAVATDNTLDGSNVTQAINFTGLSYGPTEQVTVTPAGGGSGLVYSNLTGLNCNISNGSETGPTCQYGFSSGFTVTFYAIPANGSTFSGWGSACASIGTTAPSGGACTLSIPQNTTNIIANFAPVPTYALTVTEPGTGSGTVTDNLSQITCTETSGTITGSACSGSYTSGTAVTLTASAAAGSVFTGWGGACASYSPSPTCTVTMNAAAAVTAYFAPGDFGGTNVCANGNVSGCTGATQTVTFNFTTSTAVSRVQAVTQGASNLDFSALNGGTCIGSFTSGQSCTATVTFTPTAPGLRMGAVQLLSDSGVLLASQPISGVGQGPAAALTPATQTMVSVNNSYGLANPQATAVDAAGDVYIANSGASQVLKVAAGTGLTTGVGSNFVNPVALAVDGAGDVYVVDNSLHEVVEVLADGVTQNVVYGPASNSNSYPNAVAVDGAGDLFIAEGNVVEEYPADGGASFAVYGGVDPLGIAVDAGGDLFVADPGQSLVIGVPAGCNITLCQDYNVIGGTGWSSPVSVALDAAGDAYVVDTGLATGSLIQVPPSCINYTSETTNCVTTMATGIGASTASVDSAGDVILAETGNNQVVELNQSVPISLNFGSVSVGNSSGPQTVTLQNIGNQSLNAISPGLAESDTDFHLLQGTNYCTSSFSLSPSSTCTLTFDFAPVNIGSLSGIAYIDDNALNNSSTFPTQSINLTGLGYGSPVTVSVTGTGTGNVSTASFINCAIVAGVAQSGCSESTDTGNTYTFYASPIVGTVFTGWGGACSSFAPNQNCTIEITGPATIIANFAPATTNYTLTVTDVGTGSGSVTSGDGNIGCVDTSGGVTGNPSCSSSYASETQVTLTASASGNSIFAGWGGACSGASATCMVTINSATSVSASFAAPGPAQPSTLAPITAGVVWGQGGSFTSPAGNYDGIAADSLNQPENLALDSNGNLYVADLQNSRVLYYPAGSTTATLVYGQDGSFTNGTAPAVSASSLNNPYGIAVDSGGNLYIADWNNNRVLFYSKGSTTASLVYGQGGSFTSNTANNGGISATSLSGPQSVALDSSGNLYVADTNNNRVVVYSAGSTTNVIAVYGQGGSYTTANNTPVSANSLNRPFAIALDSSGDLYVADDQNNRVLFYPAGSTTATRVYGQGGSFTSSAQNYDGVAADSLWGPQGVTVDSGGNLYVADYFNSRVLFYPFGSTTATRVYGQSGSFNTNNANTDANSLSNPAAVALDSSGDVYVADKSNNRVLEYGPFGNFSVAGAYVPGPFSGTFTLSYYAASDTTFGTPQVFTQGQTGLDFNLALLGGGTCIGTGTVSAGNVCTVNVTFAPLAPGLRKGAIDLYDSSTPANLLASMPMYGVGQAPALAFGPGVQTSIPAIGLVAPVGVALDGLNDLFVADYAGHKVVKITQGGAQSTVQATGVTSPIGVAVDGAGDLFIADQNLTNAVEITPAGVQTAVGSGLSNPYGIAVDGQGNVYIGDRDNNRVVRVTPSGVQTTVPATGLNTPQGVAVDAAGDVFIADVYNTRVVEVTPGGVQTTIPAVGLGLPYGVAVDAAGDVFIADAGNGVLWEVTPGAAQIQIGQGLVYPSAVTVDGAGDVFIGDQGLSQPVEVNRSQLPSLSFGSQSVNTASSALSATFQNIGNQTLTGSVLGIGSGFNLLDLNSSGSCYQSSGFTLTAGQSCNVSIDFEPTAATSYSATATFNSNSLYTNYVTQSIGLSGTGMQSTPTNYTLSVSLAGTGSGTVTDNSQITCVETYGTINTFAGSCSASYTSGAQVTLTATAASGSTFLGWGGACASFGTSAACTVAMSSAQSVSASFSPESLGGVNVCAGGVPSTQCTASGSSRTVTFDFTGNITVSAVQAVTEGATGLDFSAQSGSSCVGTFTAGGSCTVNVTFAPLAPGLRTGAVELLDGSGNVLASQLIYGQGQAPLAAFGPAFSITPPYTDNNPPPVFSTQVTSLSGGSTGMTTDEAGNLYEAAQTEVIIQAPPYSGNPLGSTTTLSGFTNAEGVAIDGAGNLYVADKSALNPSGGQGEVLRLSPSCVSSIVGGSSPSSCGVAVYQAAGPPEGPVSLAVDGQGDLFIANNPLGVFEIPANGSGQETLYNPTPNCTTSPCSAPTGVAVDAAGDVFIADSGLKQVVELLAGCSAVGCASTNVGGGWQQPYSVAVDAAGDVLVADPAYPVYGGNGALVNVPAGCTSSNCQTVLFTAGNGDPVGIALTATGQLFVDTDAGFYEIDESQPPAVGFGQTDVGNTSGPDPVTIQNIGNLQLTVSMGGVSTQNFAEVLSSPCNSALPLNNGATCTEYFEFTPQSGSASGTLLSDSATVTDNTLNGSSAKQTINLSGTGLTIPTDTIAVTLLGNGAGTVTSSPGTINCSNNLGACSSNLPANQQVVLTETPAPGSTFQGWGTPCSGTSTTCTFTVDNTYDVSATFTQQTLGSVSVCPGGTAAGCTATTLPITFSFAAATNIGAVQVVTQGVDGLDFTLGSGSTCSGPMTTTSLCTVYVNFTPLAPGLRVGAVELFDVNGNLVASEPVSAIGLGPAAAFTPATPLPIDTGSSFTLSAPNSTTVDAAGDVFIADTGNSRVVEISVYGIVSTVGAALSAPQAVAIDGAGNLFVADTGLGEVVKIPSGCNNNTCQSAVYGPSTGNPFSPVGVAVDASGDLFIADTSLNTFFGEILEIPAGCNSSTCQVPVYMPALNPKPVGLALDAAGDLFFADNPSGVFELTAAQIAAGCISSSCPAKVGTGWSTPQSVSLDAAGDVYVFDSGLGQIVEVLPPTCVSNCQITLASGISSGGATVDAAGDVFIAESANNQLVELPRSLPPSLNFALTNVGSPSSDSPQPVSVQNVGNQALSVLAGATSTASFAGNQTGSTCGTATASVVAPGASCSETFTFTPQSTGILSDSASFTDTTLNITLGDGSQTVNLSGIGSTNGATGTAVPNVIGKTEGVAATYLTAAGLTLGTVGSEYSNNEPAGAVIGESPAAGTPVNLGSNVNLLISTGEAPPPAPNPLTFENNYFVTGDFATAGTSLLHGAGNTTTNLASGTITIPDSTGNPGTQGVPDGADIVDGFLYWETLENTATPSGGTGTFLGYQITGQQVGNDVPYTDGANTGTLRVYRADVNNYFQAPSNFNGERLGSGPFAIALPDSGGGMPMNEGASMVVIYRALVAPGNTGSLPLKSVVIYDGSTIPAGSVSQTIQGFYDAYGTNAEVATLYSAGSGNWNSAPTSVALAAHASSYTLSLNQSDAYAAIIFSTQVTNSDNDGILDAWKNGPAAPDFFAGQPGYYDVKTQSWVPLPGAKTGEKDLFVQLDYMCGAVDSLGNCSGENLFPSPDAAGDDPLAMVTQAFAQSGITLHLEVGNAVAESTCTDSAGQQLCQFPDEPGVVGWKNSLEFSKLWPRNFTSCASGGDCTTRFPYGQKDSYHYVLFGHSLAIPAWSTRFNTLLTITTSPAAGTTTITTTNRGAQGTVNYCPTRFTISGVISYPGLNGVYNTASCPDGQTIILTTPGVTTWTYSNNNPLEPDIGLTSGTVTSISGYSDLGGQDSAVTLGIWEDLSPAAQNMGTRANVIAGTLFHEIGHTIGLSHGGIYYPGASTGSYIPTFDVNCKPNFQSSMNYLFQLSGVGPSDTVAYSNQTLEPLSETSLNSVANLVDVNNNPATFSTSAWYQPTLPANSTESPASWHCDGTPLSAGETGYFVPNGSVAPINPAWAANQNITFDGPLAEPTGLPGLMGYDDVSNIDLRQVGATGGEFASLATVLNFGASSAPLNITPGGNVTVGAGGTATVPAGGSVSLTQGGSVTVATGAVINGGGTISFGTGVNVSLAGSATIVPGKSGVTLPIGGSLTLNGSGTITMGGGGTITMGGGGTITMGGGGSITLPLGGGTITIPSAGGEYTVPPNGTVTLNAGGTITMGGGGTITMGGGGNITMGGGGTITMGGGGNVTMGGGGTITMGGGGTITMSGGGNITLGGLGTITMGGGGTITMGGGGNITMGGGGTITMGGGGDLSIGSGGNVTLANGGAVTLTAGGSIAVNSSGGTITMGGGGTLTFNSAGGTITMGGGGTITMGGGGTITMGGGGTITSSAGSTIVPATGGIYNVPAGGTITLDSAGGTITMGGGGTVTMGGGGTITMGGGGNITMGGGGTITMGGGGNITMGGGGVVSLGGSGGNVTMGGGGNFTMGGGGTITMGGGGAVTNELDYVTADSVVRPPSSPTYSYAPAGGVQVNWNAPPFGVIQTYTITREVLDSNGNIVDGPTAIGTVSGVNQNPPATTFTDGTPPSVPANGKLIYTIATGAPQDTYNPAPRSSAPSPPAVLTFNQTIVLGPLPSSVALAATPPTTVGVTAVAQSNNTANMQLVSFTASGPCSVGSSTIDNTGTSSATVTLTSTGSCTITASQAGDSTTSTVSPAYSAATSVSGTITILPQGSTTQSQTITFGTAPTAQYGGGFTVSATSNSGLPVSFTASGSCTVAATTGTANGATTGAGPCKITASNPGGQANNNTYSAASVTQSFNITTAQLTVAAINLSSQYGSLPSLSPAVLGTNYTLTGFVNGDTASVVSGVPVLATSATSTSGAGNYAITVSPGSLAATNYSFVYSSGTLTIQQTTPTISITNLPTNAVYGGSYTATYSYAGNGTTSVTSSTPTICTASGSSVSFVGVGQCTLTAKATATTDDAAATGATQSFTVGQATPTISISNLPTNAVYGGSFVAAYTYSGTGTPAESVASTTTTVCTVSGNTVKYVGFGTCTLQASAGATTDDIAVKGSLQSFSVSKAILTVTANNQSRAYGAANPTLTVTYSGFQNGDGTSALSGSPSLSTTATTTSLPGTYPITVTQGTLAAANYTFNLVNGTLTVTFTGSVPTSGTACNGAYSGTFNGSLTVKAGQNCVFVGGGASGSITETGGNLVLDGSTVSGSVVIDGGGTFSIGPSTTIKGSVQILSLPSGSASNQMCGTTISGSLQLESNKTPALIGSGSSCAGNVIKDSVQVLSNSAAVTFDGNSVTGSLQVESNSAATTTDSNTISGSVQILSNTGAAQVFTNVITGTLQCESNSSITGSGNKAASKTGQCATF